MSEQSWIGMAKPRKPISRPLGLATQPFEFPARPADDIDIDPLEGWTQVRPVELTVVVDPAFNVRIVRLGQNRRMDRPMDVSAFGLVAGRKQGRRLPTRQARLRQIAIQWRKLAKNWRR
jgi:hypothetical protein